MRDGSSVLETLFSEPKNQERGGVKNSLYHDLIALGLIVVNDGKPRFTSLLPSRTYDLFSKVLDPRFLRLRSIRMPGCPIAFCTGIWSEFPDTHREAFRQPLKIVAGGQGEDIAAAFLSCIGEVAERLSLQTVPSADENRINSVSKTVRDLEASAFLGFSKRQVLKAVLLADEQKWCEAECWERLNAASARRIKIESLNSGEISQLPSLCGLFGEAKKWGLSGSASTSGAAVHQTQEQAFQSAFLEAVERDVFAPAWYNRLGIRFLREGQVAQNLGEKHWQYLQCRERQCAFFCVPTHFSVHVAGAVSADPDGFGAAMGVSAGLTLHEAVRSAYQEMLQSEVSQSFSKMFEQQSGTSSPAVAYGRRHRLLLDLCGGGRFFEVDGDWETEYSFQDLIDSYISAEISIWKFDATHPVYNVPCVKILSPDLCSLEPRFGRVRLYPEEVRHCSAKRDALEKIYSERVYPF